MKRDKNIWTRSCKREKGVSTKTPNSLTNYKENSTAEKDQNVHQMTNWNYSPHTCKRWKVTVSVDTEDDRRTAARHARTAAHFREPQQPATQPQHG